MKFEIISGILLFATASMAVENTPFFRGVRAQGMGGASVAIVNDETSLFLNPAGLGRIRGPYLMIANPEIEANTETNNIYGAGYQYMRIHNDPGFMLSNARLNPDVRIHARYQLLPAFVTTNFGIGVYGKYSWDAEYITSTGKYRLDHINDYGAVIGYCFRLFDGKIKIGASGKMINRVSIAKDLEGSTDTTTLKMSDLVTEGGGFGFDAGLILTGPWVFLPSIAVAGHDIGDTKFTSTTGYFYQPANRPDFQKQSIDVAFSISPILGKKVRSTITGEWRDAQNSTYPDMYRRVHAGVELNISDILFLRGGMNQRYYTAGFEFDLGPHQIQLATYGEEIGPDETKFREDRRYVGLYGFRF